MDFINGEAAFLTLLNAETTLSFILLNAFTTAPLNTSDVFHKSTSAAIPATTAAIAIVNGPPRTLATVLTTEIIPCTAPTTFVIIEKDEKAAKNPPIATPTACIGAGNALKASNIALISCNPTSNKPEAIPIQSTAFIASTTSFATCPQSTVSIAFESSPKSPITKSDKEDVKEAKLIFSIARFIAVPIFSPIPSSGFDSTNPINKSKTD